MVLDIESFRPQEDPAVLGPEGVKEIQRRRYKDPAVVDQIQQVDQKWRRANFLAEKLNGIKNLASKVIGLKKKAKEAGGDSDVIDTALLKRVEVEPEQVTQDDLNALTVTQLTKLSKDSEAFQQKYLAQAEQLDQERMTLIRTVGNVVHDSVPVSDNEDNNAVVRTVGDAAVSKTSKKYSHRDLIVMIDGVDLERGTTVAGSRCYFLKGPAVLLETALVAFTEQFLLDRGYTALSPPVFMRKEVMQEVAQLSQFDEELYKVTGKASEVTTETAEEEKYLIATSEQPIAAFHRDEWLDDKVGNSLFPTQLFVFPPPPPTEPTTTICGD
jgi:seryl-tRNA synthetase